MNRAHILFDSLCLSLILSALAPLSHAADAAPAPPDYQTVVKALFDTADTCKIKGYVVDGIVYDINALKTDAPFLQQLREMFLAEQPRYLGRDIPPHLGEYSSSRLEFTWVDAQLRELGRAALLDGDRLLINGSLLFTLSTTNGEKNTRLLWQAAHLADPYTRAAPDDAPNFRHIVSGFFAKAAACRIKGYHYMGGDHQIDYTTPDASALQELQRIFLHEKPLYLHESDPDSDVSDNGSGFYEFTWLDAQGAPLGRADLSESTHLRLNRHSAFTTNSRTDRFSDITLRNRITRLVVPGIFTPTSPTPPPPDYRAMIQELFAKAASCRIEGRYAPEGATTPYHPDFTAADPEELRILKEIFLFESPRYEWRTDGEDNSAESPERLHFTWKDAEGKELGRVFLLNEDKLEFRTTHDLFRTSEAKFGAANITLLTRAARFALPRSFGKSALPDYHNLVQGLFAKATACKIQGYYTDDAADATHEVDFTAADAHALQALKDAFLAEKPAYSGIKNPASPSYASSSSLHFFWTDAQGAELGHITLNHEGQLFFTATQELFSTSTAQSINTTLLTQAAHLALPAVYGNAKAR